MNEVVHTSPTIGSNVEEIVVNNTHFLMWDIGGQESLRSSWNTYYTNTEVIVGCTNILVEIQIGIILSQFTGNVLKSYCYIHRILQKSLALLHQLFKVTVVVALK